MPDVSLSVISNGQDADATPVNNNFQALKNAVNALDSDNWAAGKIFPLTQLAQGGATTGQALVWSGTDWAADTLDPSTLAQQGASSGQVLAWSGSAWVPTTVQQILGMVQYDPTTVTTATTTSTTGADIDATNLSLTVTVPASGKIGVHFNFVLTAAGGNSIFMGLRESTTNIAYVKLQGSADTTSTFWRKHTSMLVTGLSAGSHTYKMAFKTVSASVSIEYGTQASPATGDRGPITMIIFGVA